MKKCLAFLLIVLCISSFCSVAYGAEKNVVTAESVSAKQGETVLLPVEIRGNTGIMGFRITVKYPDQQLRLKDITSGYVTSEGLFNTSISDFNAVKGGFDVLWSHSQEVKEDGTLFLLTFEVSDIASDGAYSVNLSFSQEDTFNEAFEDVTLDCRTVQIHVGKAAATTVPASEPAATSAANSGSADVTVSDDFLISAVESVLDSFDTVNQTQAEEEKIVELTNNILKSYDEKAETYTSYAQLYAAFCTALKNQSLQEILNATDDDVIQDALKTELQAHNADTFASLSEEQKQAAVENVKQALADSNAELKTFNKIEVPVLAAETLDDLLAESDARSKETVTAEAASARERKPAENSQIAVILSVAVVFVIVVLLAILKHMKSKNNEEERK